MKKILILNGPNINLIGFREPEIYGSENYEKLCKRLKDTGEELNFYIEIFQSNSEGELIDKIHASNSKIDLIIANFGAYTHTSIALRDALLAVKIPLIEVHITNIFSREDFRKKSYFSDISLGIISGFGTYSYILALYAAKDILS